MNTKVKFLIRIKTKNGTHEEECDTIVYAKYRAGQEQKLDHKVTIYKITQEIKEIEL